MCLVTRTDKLRRPSQNFSSSFSFLNICVISTLLGAWLAFPFWGTGSLFSAFFSLLHDDFHFATTAPN